MTADCENGGSNGAVRVCRDRPPVSGRHRIAAFATLQSPRSLESHVLSLYARRGGRGIENAGARKLSHAAALRVLLRNPHARAVDASVVQRLQEIVQERQIDVIHSHDSKTDALNWMVARRNRCGILATAHGWTERSLRERAIYYPLGGRVLRRFPRVISVSREITATLVRSGVAPARITTLANGVDPDQFFSQPECRSLARKSLGVNERDFVIGAVGRLDKQKRFDLLFDAFATIRSQYPHGALLIAGDGSLQHKLQRQIDKRNLEGHSRWNGHVSTIKDFYQALDLFVRSSDSEGTPKVVLEAMALETPVIATSAGGTWDVLRADVDALIVPAEKSAPIADAIDSVRRDSNAAQARIAAARRRVASEVSFAARNANLGSIYRDLLPSCPPCR